MRTLINPGSVSTRDCILMSSGRDRIAPIVERDMVESSQDKDLIFKCRKCEHHLYVCDKKIKKIRSLSETDCPECGEEGYENWIFAGKGNYDRMYGDS